MSCVLINGKGVLPKWYVNIHRQSPSCLSLGVSAGSPQMNVKPHSRCSWAGPHGWRKRPFRDAGTVPAGGASRKSLVSLPLGREDCEVCEIEVGLEEAWSRQRQRRTINMFFGEAVLTPVTPPRSPLHPACSQVLSCAWS